MIVSNKLIRVIVDISGVEIGALIDTGASCSFVDTQWWQDINGNENGRIRLQQPTVGPIQSVTGHSQGATGSFLWPMTIHETGDTFPVLLNVVDH
jgi:hypothetical protein